MPEYTFEDERGKRVVVVLPMAEAPSIGETLTVEGRTLTRIIDAGSLPVGGAQRDVYFTSYQVPRSPFYQDAAPRIDSKGRPQFASKREVTEFCAKTGYVWNEL